MAWKRPTSREKGDYYNWGLGGHYLSGKDLSVIAKMKEAKHAARDAGPDGAGDRFAAKYYAGTFDEELNKLAVDTETMWQGYYPSLYDPHTQEAAEHLAAPMQVQIDPLTGEPYPEPEPPPVVQAAAQQGRRDNSRARRENRGIFMQTWQPNSGGSVLTDPNGAPAPTVNPDGSLIPWQYANWMISMGQWRGT